MDMKSGNQYLKSLIEKRRRPTKYTNETIQELKHLWRIFDHPCGQRLKSILQEEVDHLLQLGELSCSRQTADQLKQISAKTIDRKLAETKQEEGLKHKYRKKIHPLLYQQIHR